MLGHYTYLTIILIPGIIGILVSVFLGRKILSKKRKPLLLSIVIMTCYLYIIDLFSIHILKIWSFRPESVTGVWIAGEYLEELVLFLVTQTIIVSWAFILKDKSNR